MKLSLKPIFLPENLFFTIVPLNFGYEIKDDTYILYFHGAKEGRKIDLIQKNPHVGFEMDTDYALNEARFAK